MRALVFEGGRVSLAERPTPRPREGEALVRIRTAGICNTDVEIAKGYMGFQGVLGHEAVGEVVEGPSELRGKRVVMEINVGCGSCAVCRTRGPNHCPTRTVLGIVGKDGALAEAVAMPVGNLRLVPDSVPDDAAVFAEPLAAAIHTFDAVELAGGDRVLVIGDGKLGLLVGLALAAEPAKLGRRVMLGRHPEKLAKAAKVGIETTTDRAALGRASFDVVVEATGQPSGLEAALELVRPEGTIVLKSTYEGKAGVDLAPIVIHELKVVGSRCGDFRRALDRMAARVIDPTPLIAARFPLARAEEGFRAAKSGALKVLIENA